MNTLTFMPTSGAYAHQDNNGGDTGFIETLGTPGNLSGANHIGFFGAGGPGGVPFAVVVSNYQDKTYITNTSGQNLGDYYGFPGAGELINAKYIDSSLVSVSGQADFPVNLVPKESGTLLVRFDSSEGQVQTQNVLFRAVDLNAASGVDDTTAIPVDLKVWAFEPDVGGVWTQLAGTGAADNKLNLSDRSDVEHRHDYFLCISVSPEVVGARSNVGFFTLVEFL
jgi:hypothetical protein